MDIIRGEVPEFIDKRGVLSYFEHQLPELFDFTVHRVFWVSNVPPGAERGNHAHYDTDQILICIRGRIKVKLYDGKEQKEFFIKENDWVYIPSMVWDSQIFYSTHDVLLVLANTRYDREDYISDFEKFKKMFK